MNKRILELAGVLQESKKLLERYDSTEDWHVDMDKIEKHLKAITGIMNSSNWKQHMKDTKQNFGVDSAKHEKNISDALANSKSALDKLYDEFSNA